MLETVTFACTRSDHKVDDMIKIPVVPHEAEAEVSRIGNL